MLIVAVKEICWLALGQDTRISLSEFFNAIFCRKKEELDEWSVKDWDRHVMSELLLVCEYCKRSTKCLCQSYSEICGWNAFFAKKGMTKMIFCTLKCLGMEQEQKVPRQGLKPLWAMSGLAAGSGNTRGFSQQPIRECSQVGPEPPPTSIPGLFK